MKHQNQKERAIAVLAGNGAIVAQAFLVIVGQILFRPTQLPRFEAGGLMVCIAGIGGIGLWGCFNGYRGLALAGSETPALATRSERAIFNGLLAVGANLSFGIATLMAIGVTLMMAPGKPDTLLANPAHVSTAPNETPRP